MNYFGYMRISTKEERNKQGYGRQEKGLMRWAQEHGLDEYTLDPFRDDASGKSFDRPEWQKLEKILHKGDTVVFKDVSRFTRERENGINKYMDLYNKGINLVFLDNPTLDTDYIKNLMVAAEQQDWMMADFSRFMCSMFLKVELDRCEKERLTISKRTKDGIAARMAAKAAKGEYAKPGRKPGQLDKLNDGLKQDLVNYMQDRKIKAIDIMRKHGISRNTLKKYVAILEGTEGRGETEK